MPANSADGAIARQWEVLKIIPSARSQGLKPSDFKNELNDRGYEVSLRTVQRDPNINIECDPEVRIIR